MNVWDRYVLVLNLRKKGMTYREIGEEIKVCTSRARNLCIDAWITVNKFKTKKAWLRHKLERWK